MTQKPILAILLLSSCEAFRPLTSVRQRSFVSKETLSMQKGDMDNGIFSHHRRLLLLTAPATAMGSVVAPKPSVADTVLSAESAALPNGLLEARVTENVLSPPPYGMEGTDVFYPSWFAGSWNVYSECTDVLAPCGLALFGGNRTYEATRNDIGPQAALRYESRFLPNNSNDLETTVADREFNVKSIAKVRPNPRLVGLCFFYRQIHSHVCALRILCVVLFVCFLVYRQPWVSTA